ncbi:MAG: CPBP family intramembrane metalloprotease, partial [Paludibacteraceae bacterium]
ERALDNQNQWWKYLVIILVALFGAQLIGAIPFAITITLKTLTNGGVTPNPENAADLSIYGLPQNLSLVLLMIPFLLGLLALILLVKPMHKRTWKEVANGTNILRWNRVYTGAMVWLILYSAYLAVNYFLDKDNFQFSFNPSPFITLVVISLLLIPFQTTFEELFFRGYIVQGMAAWTRKRWLVLIVPAFFFGLMHILNPEIREFGFWIAMPQYWYYGLFLGFLTIVDDGIEMAMGVHAANNIFLSIMVTHKASVLQTPALLTQHRVNPILDTVSLVGLSLIFIFILAKKYNWKFSTLKQEIGKETFENNQ